ncbi:F-box protein SKIP3-like isoform X4 [Diospyros lotus]|uniref:F-box protein SKIP3-like isoform X4 n=1 Tax=Diospyros lotus TaxID=55363 RepID=UPI0022503507|nr:F-box protein SKIP3-like isoform X4 [Diospyros lotus]XP_052170421.1 F-box protein SKIP3-like isoform X4 [Diospyros lotus]
MADVVALTCPPVACRLQLVSSIFRSDAAWDKFLPSDYNDILALAVLDSSSSITGSPIILFSSTLSLTKNAGKTIGSATEINRLYYFNEDFFDNKKAHGLSGAKHNGVGTRGRITTNRSKQFET